MYRIKIDFHGSEVRYLSAATVGGAERMARDSSSSPLIRTVIPEVKCPEHGWSAIDAGHCAECLDEYYHPQYEEEVL